MGFTRCTLCLSDFMVNEKVKQFPGCDHLFHIKCLELWSTVDPRCPTCLRTYSPFSTNPGHGSMGILSTMVTNASLHSINSSSPSSFKKISPQSLLALPQNPTRHILNSPLPRATARPLYNGNGGALLEGGLREPLLQSNRP